MANNVWKRELTECLITELEGPEYLYNHKHTHMVRVKRNGSLQNICKTINSIETRCGRSTQKKSEVEKKIAPVRTICTFHLCGAMVIYIFSNALLCGLQRQTWTRNSTTDSKFNLDRSMNFPTNELRFQSTVSYVQKEWFYISFWYL